jgi:hypothetical protein
MSERSLFARLNRPVDSRSQRGILSRGKNVYRAGFHSPTNSNARMSRSDLIKASKERLLRRGNRTS